MPKRQFKYHTSFSNTLRCVVDKEKSKFLAKASIEDLKGVLPPAIIENGWEDLLPIAGNACVVNWANKNRDAIDTAAAVDIYQYFVRKYINVEHDRDQVVGVLEGATFTKFDINYAVGAGSDPLTQAEASAMTGPFNIALSGYIWKTVAPGVADKIVECNNPDSPDFLTLSISWELGFDQYDIAIGPQDLQECEIISDQAQVESLSKYLIQNGGPGTLEDGRPVYRLIAANSGAVPLGIGLTFSPAAAVAGVITPEFQTNASEIKENTSQSTITPVTITKETKLPLSMKVLKNIADLRSLNDETAKEYSFANIASILDKNSILADVDVANIVTEWQRKFDAEKVAKEQAVTNLQDATTKANAELENLRNEKKALEEKVNDIATKQAAAEATTKFNERMGALNENYELDDNMSASIAESIRGLSDEAYAGWLKNFANIAHKSKKVAAVEASADPKKVAEEALANAKKKEEVKASSTTPPNTPSTTPSLAERMKDAFSKENVTVTASSPRRATK